MNQYTVVLPFPGPTGKVNVILHFQGLPVLTFMYADQFANGGA